MAAILALVALVPPVAARATTGPAGAAWAPCGEVVAPGPDVTTALSAALTRAGHAPVAGVLGPAGRPQGRVSLGPGDYGLRPIVVPDDVRIELAPGATVHPARGAGVGRADDWGLFQFGTATVDGPGARPTRNVSIVAGNGCGGPGRATATNKPTRTSFRGNRASSGGMANEPVPADERWDTDAMFVVDLDPAQWDAGVQVTGFQFRWAYDIEVADVLTIQNPSRTATGIGPVPGATSRTVAMMFDPPNGAPFVADPEAQYLPHRVTVERQYNVLSPSGQGANQVRACRDCRFRSIYSHGGVALRVETDGVRPVGADCTGTGPDGQGFREFAIVDGLRARDIEGADGNRVVMFTPHCLPNGTARVRDVRGDDMRELVVVAPHQPDGPAGGFASVTVTDVSGCGGSRAQEPHPDQDSYLLAPSRAAVDITADSVTLAGEWHWPAPPAPGGLADGRLPAEHGATISHPTAC